jgi:hypothetical protein
VVSIDIVLEQDGDAVERPALLVAGTLLVQLRGLFGGIGVELDDRVQHRSGLIDSRHAFLELLHQRLAGKCAAVHALLQLIDGRPDVRGRSRFGGLCAVGCEHTGYKQAGGQQAKD